MAKYNVTNLNYIAVGPGKTLINADLELGYQIYDRIHFLSAEDQTSGYATMSNKNAGIISALSCHDIGTEQGLGYYYPSEYIQKADDTPFSTEEDDKQIILNEQQEYYIETDTRTKKYIRLFLSCCTEEMKAKIEQFNRDRVMVNQTFIADHDKNDKNDYAVSGKWMQQAYGLYDIRDVSLKKLGIKEQTNLNLHDTDQHHDIYAPSMAKMPVGFCQTTMQNDFQNDALVLTQPTSKKPYYLYSSLLDARSEISSQLDYTMQLDSRALKTYVFGKNGNPTGNPLVNFNDITYSYIVDIPVSEKSGLPGASVHGEYDDGVAYFRRLMTTKSAFNSLYSMQMSAANEIDHCRDYVEINVCGGKPYLKYYDNLKYVGDRDSESVEEAQALVDLETQKSNTEDGLTTSFEKKPFQKIEYIYPIDYKSSARHKSNLYSIVVSDTGIEQMQNMVDTQNQDNADVQSAASALKRLKFEITTAIRDIARDVAPANTQLFDVKFES